MTTPAPISDPPAAEPVVAAPAPPPAVVITESSPLPPVEPLSAEGAALIDADRAVDAVEVLLQAVAAGEPSAGDLLVRAYLDNGSWQQAVDWIMPQVEQGE